MRDRLGNHINEGDRVLFIDGHYKEARSLAYGIIEKVSDKTARVKNSDKRLRSEHLVKVTDGEVVQKNTPPKIKVKYFSEDYPRLEQTEKGDWIDLRADETVEYGAGDFLLVKLGVAMELPEGYEAIVAPRSSTFKNYGVIMTNSLGVIDNSYKGNNDEWQFPMLATRKGKISRGDRICQFRIQKSMGKVVLNEVEKLENADRNGFGSSGVH